MNSNQKFFIDKGPSSDKRRRFSFDRSLVPRVLDFIRHSNETVTPTIDEIVQHLQGAYIEYGRRKQHALRQSVSKVLSNERYIALLNESRQKVKPKRKRDVIRSSTQASSSQPNSSESETNSDGSDTEELVEIKDTNMINTSMSALYKSQSQKLEDKQIDGKQDSVFSDASMTDVTTNGVLPIPIDLERNSSEADMRTKSDSEILFVKKVPPLSRQTPVSSSTPKEKPKQQNNKTPVAKKSKGITASAPTATLQDVAGCDEAVKDICKLLFHMKHQEIFSQLGVTPPRGILLHGPPGCGKTLLANAIAGELQLPFYKLAATEIVSGVSGESEQKVRELFAQAIETAPCLIFIDEIDAITPKRENASKDMERRIVAQLLTCLDDLVNAEAHVMIIGATNRPDSLDPALRRAGRFDREIAIGIPDKAAREKILKVLCKDLKLSDEFNCSEIADATPGYVGADLMALTREAAMSAVDRIFEELKATEDIQMVDNNVERCIQPIHELKLLQTAAPLTAAQLESLSINNLHFQAALKKVQPSSKREGFVTVPDVTWRDIGALENVRDELTMAILAPVRNPAQFASLGLITPPGILLAGPPGCGKTLLAKAIANEAGINFISVKGPELLNMYVGESEKAVRQVFQRARNSSPCVIFFDEIDALCPRRSDMAESSASSRVVNQLLTEMDGLQTRKQVYIMGATNRPDIIDRAVLRPGRLDKLLFVGLPNTDDRLKILKTITKDGTCPLMESAASLEVVSSDSRCEGYSGADLAALVREAAVAALREHMVQPSTEQTSSIVVELKHFETAFSKVVRSVSEKDRLWYEDLRKRHSVS